MKPTKKPFKFLDRTKKLSRNEKIVAGVIIFFGLIFLYSEWEWRDRQDRESADRQREYCSSLMKISMDVYLADKDCNK